MLFMDCLLLIFIKSDIQSMNRVMQQFPVICIVFELWRGLQRFWKIVQICVRFWNSLHIQAKLCNSCGYKIIIGTFEKCSFSRTYSPVTVQLTCPEGDGQVYLILSTPSHWLIRRASFPYINHERYFIHWSEAGMVLLFTNRPPSSMSGMRMVGASTIVISVVGDMQETRYPEWR